MAMFPDTSNDVTLHPETIRSIEFILRWAMGASELELATVKMSDNQEVIRQRMDLIRAIQIAIRERSKRNGSNEADLH